MRSLVPFLILGTLLTGCTLSTDYFGEYRGVNLLGNYDFDDLDGATPKWGLAITPTPGDFMTWERIGDPADPNGNLARDTAASTPTVGPDSASPVYRLEIKNLIPNGDFEDSTVTPDGTTTVPTNWTVTDGTATPSYFQFGFTHSANSAYPNRSINGISLGWWGAAPGDNLSLDLDAAVQATAWRNIPYRFHVDFINISDLGTLGILLDDPTTTKVPENDTTTTEGGGTWDQSTLVGDPATANHTSVFSPTRWLLLAATTDQRTLIFGSAGVLARYGAVLDNLRLLPDNLPLVVAAEFPSISSGIKPLLPGSKTGMYTFTVAVRTDPTAGTLNRFAARSFSVVVTAREKSGIRSYPITFSNSEWSAAWTTLNFDLGLDMVNSDADLGGQPALKITLSPTVTNSGSVDVGSLLLSQPTLTFNP